jgi:hypothetical protein
MTQSVWKFTSAGVKIGGKSRQLSNLASYECPQWGRVTRCQAAAMSATPTFANKPELAQQMLDCTQVC